jgi:hypothetical protein
VSRITGMARSTIGRGLAELRSVATDVAAGRVRRPGGRKELTSSDATLLDDLLLSEPASLHPSVSPLGSWTLLIPGRVFGAQVTAANVLTEPEHSVRRSRERPSANGTITRRKASGTQVRHHRIQLETRCNEK